MRPSANALASSMRFWGKVQGAGRSCNRRFPEGVTKGPELAGICATVRSQRRHRYSRQLVSAHFSLAPKSRFPETETARGRDSVRMPVTPKEVRAWCCRDHPLAVRAQNLIDDFNFTLHSLDRRHAVTLELLIERTTLLQFGSIGDQHGYRHCEVVQSDQRLRVHSAARRWKRCVRTHQCRRTCRTDIAQ